MIINRSRRRQKNADWNAEGSIQEVLNKPLVPLMTASATRILKVNSDLTIVNSLLRDDGLNLFGDGDFYMYSGTYSSFAQLDSGIKFDGSNRCLDFVTGHSIKAKITNTGRSLWGATLPSDDGSSVMNVNGQFKSTKLAILSASSQHTVDSFANGDGYNNIKVRNSTGELWIGVSRDDGLSPLSILEPFAPYVIGSSPHPLILGAAQGKAIKITTANNVELYGSLKTASPSVSTSKPWLLGQYHVGSVPSTPTGYVVVQIDGVPVYLPAYDSIILT